MATLHPPLDGLSAGKHDLQVSLLGWHTVGSCTIAVNDPFHFDASGSYDAMGKKGTFDMKLALTDQDPAASSGPCKISNDGQTFDATYVRNGNEISFTARDHSITVSPDGNNVLMQVRGFPKFRILG